MTAQDVLDLAMFYVPLKKKNIEKIVVGKIKSQ